MIKCSEALGKIIERRERYFTPDERETVNVAHGKLILLEEMEKQGRLVILPCKVGKRIYKTYCGFHVPICINCYDIGGLGSDCAFLNNHNCTNDPANDKYGRSIGIASMRFTYDMIPDIGKTVFLTREEAEAALKGETEDV